MSDPPDDPAIGGARCPGPSTRDIILGDSVQPPAALLVESPVYLGSDNIAFDEYTSRDFAEAEHEHLWSRTWQWACRLEHIPEPGDYYVYDIGDRSALIVHGSDGEIRAFYNACLHRGTQLKAPATCGISRELRCPFHGWTWSIDGELINIPSDWDFAHFEDDSSALPQIRSGIWGGFVFVNWDENADPLEVYLGVLIEHFADWDLADRYIEAHARKRLPANWKAAASAFLEAYHVVETHSQALPSTGDANAQYDIFGDNVSRFVHTTATPSPHIADKDQLSEQEQLARLFPRGDEPPEIPEGERARDVYARWVQESLGETYGHDFSGLSVSETIDSIEYFLFPNAFFFPGLQFPMVYRFRPDGDDPDSSIFEVLILRPKPTDRAAPPPPEPFDLSIEDSYALTPGFSKGLGMIYDQDTSNLAAQTRGFKASARSGQVLGNYQEVRVRHLHDGVKRYLKGASARNE